MSHAPIVSTLTTKPQNYAKQLIAILTIVSLAKVKSVVLYALTVKLTILLSEDNAISVTKLKIVQNAVLITFVPNVSKDSHPSMENVSSAQYKTAKLVMVKASAPTAPSDIPSMTRSALNAT